MGGAADGGREYSLTVWDVATGRLRAQIALPIVSPLPPFAVAFPSADRVIAPFGLDELRTWDLATGELLGASTLPVGENRYLLGVLGNLGGRITAVVSEQGGRRGLAALWDVHTGRKIWDREDSKGVRSFAWTEDGSVRAGFRDGTIFFFEQDLSDPGSRAATGPELARFVTDAAGQSDPDLRVSAFSRDGSRFAYFDPDDGGIRILAPAAGSPSNRARLSGHSDLVLQICFTSDGSRLVAGSLDHTLSVWDVATRERTHTLRGHEGPVTGVFCSPDGRSVFSTSSDGTVALWDTSTGVQRFRLDGGHSSDELAQAAAFVRGGGRSSHMFGVLKSGRQIFSPDGRRLVHHAAGPDAWVVDTATGEILMTLPGADTYERLMFGDAVEFSPGGRRILNGHLLWDADSGELIRELGGSGQAFSPDGSRIAGFVGPVWGAPPPKDAVLPGSSLSVRTGEVVVWDGRSGKGVRVFRDEFDHPSTLRFSPDGRRFARVSIATSRVNVWDAETGDLITTLCCPARPYAARFSPDGRRVLPQSQQDGLGVWDLEGNELVTLTPAAAPYTVAWSPDGSLIAAALHDGSIQLWEALPWGE